MRVQAFQVCRSGGVGSVSALEKLPSGAREDGSGSRCQAEALVRRRLTVSLDGIRRLNISAIVDRFLRSRQEATQVKHQRLG